MWLRRVLNVVGKCFFLSASSFVLYKTILTYYRRKKCEHIPGPKTKGLLGFYVGNFLEIVELTRNDKVWNEQLIKWHDEFGEVFKFQFFSRIVIFTTNKEAIKETLVVKNFPKTSDSMDVLGFPLGERFLGRGLVTELDAKKWKPRRALFNPGFHRNVLMTFVTQFNSIADVLMDNLRLKADGKTLVSLLNEMNRATLDAIALIAFGLNTNAVSDEKTKINVYLANIARVTNDIFLDPFLKFKPSRSHEIREYKENIRYLRKIGRERILASIESFKMNEDSLSNDNNNVLSAILKSNKNDNLDLETMVDDFVTFFGAGQETTANTLAFCFLELAREEIDRVLGKRSEITYQDVNELKYCSSIFKETLRLFPPVPSISRRVTEEFFINEYKIPTETTIVVSTYVNARQERFFKNAYTFKPERFLKGKDFKDSKTVIENYAYLPFSAGPRNCIGMNFAQIEGVIMIAKFIQKFDFKLESNQSFLCMQNITMRPKDGTKCFLTTRSF